MDWAYITGRDRFGSIRFGSVLFDNDFSTTVASPVFAHPCVAVYYDYISICVIVHVTLVLHYYHKELPLLILSVIIIISSIIIIIIVIISSTYGYKY